MEYGERSQIQCHPHKPIHRPPQAQGQVRQLVADIATSLSALSGVPRPESVFSDNDNLNSDQLEDTPSDRLRSQRSEYRSARHTGLPNPTIESKSSSSSSQRIIRRVVSSIIRVSEC